MKTKLIWVVILTVVTAIAMFLYVSLKRSAFQTAERVMAPYTTSGFYDFSHARFSFFYDTIFNFHPNWSFFYYPTEVLGEPFYVVVDHRGEIMEVWTSTAFLWDDVRKTWRFVPDPYTEKLAPAIKEGQE